MRLERRRRARRVWAYLFDGPFAVFDDFAADLEAKARSVDPLFFAASTTPRTSPSATRP